MPIWAIYVVVGFFAQMIVGSLGMGYGVITTTFLLTAGVAPAVASASVHMAELVVSVSAGVSHGKLGHVDRRGALWLGASGFVGAFFGAIVLTSLSVKAAKPVVAILLMLIGLYLLARFIFQSVRTKKANVAVDIRPLPPFFLAPLGVAAGFFDAIGGGGWGPIVTPTLMMTNRMETRNVVGTSNTARFLVSLGAISGFLVAAHGEHFVWPVVLPLIVSGILAAPLAALLTHKLPGRVLGVAISGLIIFLNGKTLLAAFPALENATMPLLIGFVLLWAIAIGATAVGVRRSRASLAEA